MNGDLRILLVDDNEGCRELYALWLDGNYDVQTAENGLAAIETVTDDIDLVLLDRNMPGPNGVDVAEKLREDGYDGGIIMVSSQPLDFDLSQSPFDNYVQKPTQRGNLEHAVERFVTRQRLQDKLNEYYASTATLATLEAQHLEADSQHSTRKPTSAKSTNEPDVASNSRGRPSRDSSKRVSSTGRLHSPSSKRLNHRRHPSK